MQSIEFTFITPAARETYNVIGRDRADACKTAFKLAEKLGDVRMVIARPIHFTKGETPCQA